MSEQPSPRRQCELKLKAASELCQVSLNVLESASNSPPSASEPDLAKLHADLLSLLSLIYHITTKLALALNPNEPTFSAAISPLDELVKHVNALTSCTSLFTTTFGSTLRTEVVGLTSDVLQATKGFIDNCILITDGATPPPKLKAAHLYLVGSLHELIDRCRGPDGLPENNLQAIRKKWSQDRSVLEDGYRELSELLTPDGADNDSLNDDFGDEDGLMLDSAPLTTEEAERVNKVQRYIRVTNLLHERVYLDLLQPSALKVASSSPDFVFTLDEISHQSTRFVSATDEIISCLHSPQDPHTISEHLENLGEVVTTLQRLLSQGNFLPKEQRAIQASEGAQKKAKWFDACLTQVDKLQASLSADFNG